MNKFYFLLSVCLKPSKIMWTSMGSEKQSDKAMAVLIGIL